MRAQDVMQTGVISVHPDTPIEQAISIMLERRISGMPVVDEAGHLVGIVSEADLLRRAELGTERQRPRWLRLLLSPGRLADEYARAHGRHIEEIMTRDVVTVGEEAPLEEVVELMTRKGVKRVPVVAGGTPVGMISRADILRALDAKFRDRAAAPARSDADILRDIKAEFALADCIPIGLIDVSVRNGVVELEGSVTDERERAAIHVAAENVSGVKEIHDHLAWIEPMSGLLLLSPDDEARAKAAQTAQNQVMPAA